MSLRDRTLVFKGMSLSSLGCRYSTFVEDLPEPKVFKVNIPAGKDLDITDSLGVVGYHNGRHRLTFLIYSNTEEQRLSRKRTLTTLLHGKRGEYTLSWEPSRTYTGRAFVTFDHFTENADLMTLTIDREPYSVGPREHIDFYAPNTSAADGRGLLQLTGSARYHNVWAVLLQQATVSAGGITTQFAEAGQKQIAPDLYGVNTVAVRLNYWLFGIDDNGNMFTNPTYTTETTTDNKMDVTINVNEDRIAIGQPEVGKTTSYINFLDYDNQLVKIYFNRWDL